MHHIKCAYQWKKCKIYGLKNFIYTALENTPNKTGY